MPIISPTAISPHRIGGAKNWSSYWATLISATVENAEPTHVVLTFPTAQTSLGASDFTIAGFTIASASWTGVVLTLVVSYAVTAYAGNLTITFTKTGGTATVTNNVAIANTVGWYVAGDGSATYVTKDGSDLVSVWKDLSGANHPLNQATETNQPLWTADGVLFDGMKSFLKTDTFNYIQPAFVYAVVKMITWANARYIWDGYANDKLVFYQSGVSPQVKIYAGKLSAVNGNLTMETLGIVRALYYGTSSKLIIDNTTPLTGDIGNYAPQGITLGARGDAGANTFGNILFAELIYRNTADDAATETAIYNYLANKYGFATI